jgi:hypothetical protein
MLSTVLLHVKRIPYIEFSNIQINAVHTLQPNSLRSVLMLHSHLRLALPSSLFPLQSPTKSLHAPQLADKRATFPAHLNLYESTALKFGKVYNLLSCNNPSQDLSFFHSDFYQSSNSYAYDIYLEINT